MIPDNLPIPLASVALAGGVALLVKGADALITGAVRTAAGLGVSPFLIGLTVVAFGTSAPELAASIGATLRGSGGIAVGNVVGSNIANIGLILGLTALARPIPVRREVVMRDLPLTALVTVLASLPMLDGLLHRSPDGSPAPAFVSRLDGLLLIAGLFAYVLFSARAGTLNPADAAAEALEPDAPDAPRPDAAATRWLPSLVRIVLGLAALVLGADLLVSGAIAVATSLGVPQVVIGLTIVAVGTSLPELVVSVQAARRGQSDIALANVLGSNVFNLLGVLGIAALVRPFAVPAEAVTRDIWVMLAATFLLLPALRCFGKVTRPEGGLMVAGFALYVWAAFAQPA